MSKKLGEMYFLGTAEDADLHSLREISNQNHLRHLKNHCLRQGKKYEGVKSRMIKMRNRDLPAHTTSALHLVFEADYRPYSHADFSELEVRYREFVMAMAMERVIAPTIPAEYIYTITMVSGENVKADGEKYQMVPAIHMLLASNTPYEYLDNMLPALYTYMKMHGYNE